MPGDDDVGTGEKLQDAPCGNPEQPNETVELNPNSLCTMIKALPLCPEATEIRIGLMDMEKSEGMM